MSFKFLKLSPLTVTLSVACFIIGLLVTVRLVTPVRSSVQLSLHERARLSSPTTHAAAIPVELEEAFERHPIYYRAERVREISDLTLGLMLYYCKQAMSSGTDSPTGAVPATLDALLAETNTAQLLPPGIRLSPTDSGVLNSVYSTYYVRYRPRPFGLEIISVPRGLDKDGGLLMRAPANPNAALPAWIATELRTRNAMNDVRPVAHSFVALYETDKKTHLQIPHAAFASVEQLARYGWRTLELPAPAHLPESEANRLRGWMNDPK